MPRKIFYSFHYQRDSWRASKIRNIGVVEGNQPASDNKWEEVKRGGEAAIKRWIDDQLQGRTCTIVLVGAETANRPWIRYEIEQSWNSGQGLLGIRVHKLLDHNQQPGSTPILRTLPLSPILGKRSVYVQAQALQPGVQARAG